jgi:hypothetical protein
LEDAASLVDGCCVCQWFPEHSVQQLFATPCFHLVEQVVDRAFPEFAGEIQFFKRLPVCDEMHIVDG